MVDNTAHSVALFQNALSRWQNPVPLSGVFGRFAYQPTLTAI